ncbi:MAG: thioredoxin family protein [Planctomycetota bacterium]|jgi:tetratricopeptide (TPR) repeat protein|nr:thioredoxin family protein [Planctomycetota bacterium]MDP7249435.1 thioredoxin family protein [Planctomycetota bacterium]
MKALLTLTLTLISPAWAQEELEWIDDLEAAKKASKLADLPLFIMLTRTGDTDCKKQEIVFQEEKVAEFLNNFILCRMNVGVKATIKFMNRNRIRGVSVPYMALFAKDHRTKMMAYSGLLRSNQFLETFKPALDELEQGPQLTPHQMITEYLKRSQKATNEKRYKLALENVDKAIAQAYKLKMPKNAEKYRAKKKFLDQYGQIQMIDAKKKMKAGDIDGAIGTAKRVILDFEGRIPAKQAQEWLDSLKKDKKYTSKVIDVMPLKEGYKKQLKTVKEETEPKPKPKRKPKNLVRLTLKDGTTLIGSIVTRAGDQIFFKLHSDDPKQRKSKFIKAADIAKEEKVE